MSSLPPGHERLDHLTFPLLATTLPSFLTRPWSSILSRASLIVNLVKNYGYRPTWNELIKQGQGPIDILPGDVLLDIFDFYLKEAQPTLGDFKVRNAWFTLVHVCRKWRNVVFASTRRLDLQLVCTDRTPVTKILDGVWPVLPIFILQHTSDPEMADVHWHNIIAALKQTDRVCGIKLDWVPNLVLEKILPVMQQPFPALKYLYLVSMPFEPRIPMIPDSFLGGSAPHLRSLQLGRVEFRGLSNLLLSAPGLVTLSLWNIRLFVPPDRLELQSASGQRSPSSTRIVFPALTRFEFHGLIQPLEDIVAHVDVPILHSLSINILYHNISSIPRLSPLISPLNSKAPDNALIVFRHNIILVIFRSQTTTSGYEALRLKIINNGPDLLSLALVCGLSLPPLPTVERLYVMFGTYHGRLRNAQWPDLLYPFTALKELYLSDELAPVSEGAIKVLPTLQDITSESQLQEVISDSYVPRKLFGYHIVREPDALDRPPVTFIS